MKNIIIKSAESRYTAKSFDKTKIISEENIDAIKKLLQLAPSSTNAQPSYFIIASSDDAKEKIAKSTDVDFAFNSDSIRKASHVIILCTKTDMDEAHLQKVLAKEELDGRFPDAVNKEQMHNGRSMFVNFHRTLFNDLPHWLEKQTYITLGFLLSGLSMLDIDSVTMEGFSSDVIDKEFNLAEQGYKSTLLVPIGYHADDDYNAKLPKSRLDESDIIKMV